MWLSIYLFLQFLFALMFLVFYDVFVFSVSLPGDDVLRWLRFLSVPSESVCVPCFFSRPCSRFGLIWLRVSCDHGCWRIRSGSVTLEINNDNNNNLFSDRCRFVSSALVRDISCSILQIAQPATEGRNQ